MTDLNCHFKALFTISVEKGRGGRDHSDMSDLNCEFPSGADLTSSHQTKVRNILNILGINIHQQSYQQSYHKYTSQSYNKATKKLQQLYSKETTNLLKSYKK